MVQGLKPYAEDAAFRGKWAAIKYHNKERLAAKLKEWTGISVPVNSMYDVQIKRIHEYKRQYMNMISVIYRYKLIKVRPGLGPTRWRIQASFQMPRCSVGISVSNCK